MPNKEFENYDLFMQSAQSDLSFCWVQISFCWFSHPLNAANMYSGFPTTHDSNQSPQVQRLAIKLIFILLTSRDIILSIKRITKAMISMRGAQTGMCLCCSQSPEDCSFLVSRPICISKQVPEKIVQYHSKLCELSALFFVSSQSVYFDCFSVIIHILSLECSTRAKHFFVFFKTTIESRSTNRPIQYT